MVSLLAHAQNLVYTLLSLMPSTYQQENLEAMFGMFLEAQGYPLPQHSKSKSPSALSRFINIYNWSTRGVIRTARNRIIKEIIVHQNVIHSVRAIYRRKPHKCNGTSFNGTYFYARTLR
jgi:hypothetical protein